MRLNQLTGSLRISIRILCCTILAIHFQLCHQCPTQMPFPVHVADGLDIAAENSPNAQVSVTHRGNPEEYVFGSWVWLEPALLFDTVPRVSQ